MLLRLHSISRWCYLHKIPVIPRVIQGVIQLFFKCILPPECSIGPGTQLHRYGWCIGLHPNVEIGRDCNVHNLVEITGCDTQQTGSPVRIIIGDRVKIHSGAKVLCKSGTLTIGEGSTIGANAAVESDVPAYSLVTGVPARCLADKLTGRHFA
jgi:serine O-acetyltransferase